MKEWTLWITTVWLPGAEMNAQVIDREVHVYGNHKSKSDPFSIGWILIGCHGAVYYICTSMTKRPFCYVKNICRENETLDVFFTPRSAQYSMSRIFGYFEGKIWQKVICRLNNPPSPHTTFIWNLSKSDEHLKLFHIYLKMFWTLFMNHYTVKRFFI